MPSEQPDEVSDEQPDEVSDEQPDQEAEGQSSQPVSAVADQVPPVAEPTGATSTRASTGVVTSSKADKTITVRIERRVQHPVYGKFVRRSTRIAAHDEHNECREGDVVTIVESRPVSKTKSWRLLGIVERAAEHEADLASAP